MNSPSPISPISLISITRPQGSKWSDKSVISLDNGLSD